MSITGLPPLFQRHRKTLTCSGFQLLRKRWKLCSLIWSEKLNYTCVRCPVLPNLIIVTSSLFIPPSSRFVSRPPYRRPAKVLGTTSFPPQIPRTCREVNIRKGNRDFCSGAELHSFQTLREHTRNCGFVFHVLASPVAACCPVQKHFQLVA